MSASERWFLTADGCEHVIAVEPAGLGRRVTWQIDGRTVASRTASDTRIRLTPEPDGDGPACVVGLRFGWFGPARRVTWHAQADKGAAFGVGGIDFRPEAGSKAGRRDAWIRSHPKMFTASRIGLAALALAAAFAIGPIVSWLVATVPWPSWQVPAIPWPDLPSLPLPAIDLPDWSLPDWIGEVLNIAKYVVPVVIAFVLARAEIHRHRRRMDRH